MEKRRIDWKSTEKSQDKRPSWREHGGRKEIAGVIDAQNTQVGSVARKIPDSNSS